MFKFILRAVSLLIVFVFMYSHSYSKPVGIHYSIKANHSVDDEYASITPVFNHKEAHRFRLCECRKNADSKSTSISAYEKRYVRFKFFIPLKRSKRNLSHYKYTHKLKC